MMGSTSKPGALSNLHMRVLDNNQQASGAGEGGEILSSVIITQIKRRNGLVIQHIFSGVGGIDDSANKGFTEKAMPAFLAVIRPLLQSMKTNSPGKKGHEHQFYGTSASVIDSLPNAKKRKTAQPNKENDEVGTLGERG